jgi:hypothetical protein
MPPRDGFVVSITRVTRCALDRRDGAGPRRSLMGRSRRPWWPKEAMRDAATCRGLLLRSIRLEAISELARFEKRFASPASLIAQTRTIPVRELGHARRELGPPSTCTYPPSARGRSAAPVVPSVDAALHPPTSDPANGVVIEQQHVTRNGLHGRPLHDHTQHRIGHRPTRARVLAALPSRPHHRFRPVENEPAAAVSGRQQQRRGPHRRSKQGQAPPAYWTVWPGRGIVLKRAMRLAQTATQSLMASTTVRRFVEVR